MAHTLNIKVYDSMTRKKQVFEPDDPKMVRMYVCGPTVYDRAHIGNLRSAVSFDIINRVLRDKFGENSIYYTRNYTDVDDKIINKALTTNQSIANVTSQSIKSYEKDLQALNVLKPDFTPKISDNMISIIDMIEQLINRDFAYEIEGHVFFSVDKYPEHGKLSNRNKNELKNSENIGSSLKKDPKDFVLWKPSKENELYLDGASYSSPWGNGRPGWHIECSSLINTFFGGVVDIHGGGIDLKFPHHENEITQSQCVCDHSSPLAKYWLHNEMVTVNGRKMGKSYNNVLTLDDLNIDPKLVRFVMMKTHYRKILDWKDDSISSIEKEYRKLSQVKEDEIVIDTTTQKMLYDDFNIAGVIGRAHQLYKENRWIELSGINKLLSIA